MARPQKQGMDYFPHDTDAAGDEKLEVLRALYGNDGYAFYFILLERIYRTADFELDVSDSETIQILAKKVEVTQEKFAEMLQTALKRRCFCSVCYADRQVLTSPGIKKRAQGVVQKRSKMASAYQQRQDKPANADNEGVSDAETTPETHVSAEFPSREKESKVKERKEEKKKGNAPAQSGKPKEERAVKTAYRDNVFLTEAEYKTLVEKHGQPTADQCLDKLDAHKLATGQTYKSDYGAIYKWVLNAVTEDAQRINRYNSNRPSSSATPSRPPDPNPSTFGTPASDEQKAARAQVSMQAKREREAAELPF